jgi:hypothetical protein
MPSKVTWFSLFFCLSPLFLFFSPLFLFMNLPHLCGGPWLLCDRVTSFRVNTISGCLLPVWVRAHHVLKEDIFASVHACHDSAYTATILKKENRISQAKNEKCLSLSRLL